MAAGLSGCQEEHVSKATEVGADKLHSVGADIPRGKVWTSDWKRVSDAYLVFFLTHVRQTSDFGGVGLRW